MKVSFLCNSLIALPSAHYLIEQNCLAGLATTARNHVLRQQLQLLAREYNVPFSTISAQHTEADLKEWIENAGADVVVVQTFPHRIPASCLSLPPLGFYNIHPSPLPDYKGPDPIFWQICNNESETGVTLHKMEESFDTGPILHIEKVPVDIGDTYGIVESNLSFAAIQALQAFLSCESIASHLKPQEKGAGHFQSKPGTEHLVIDWVNMPAAQIQALVRACNPRHNGAISFFRDVLTRLLEVTIQPLERIPKLAPGTVIAGDATRGLQVLTCDEKAMHLNVLHIEEGYFSGKQFCEIFEVGLGEKFCIPAFLS